MLDCQVNVGLGEQEHLVAGEVQTLSAELYLLGGLLAAEVQYLLPAGGHVLGYLEHQGGLADTRLACQQHHGAGDDSAPQDAVEFLAG